MNISWVSHKSVLFIKKIKFSKNKNILSCWSWIIPDRHNWVWHEQVSIHIQRLRIILWKLKANIKYDNDYISFLFPFFSYMGPILLKQYLPLILAIYLFKSLGFSIYDDKQICFRQEDKDYGLWVFYTPYYSILGDEFF